MTHLAPSLGVALALLVIAAGTADVLTRRIPNWLVAAGAIAGFSLQCGLSGWAGAKASALGFALGLAIFMPLFLLRGMGGGDVKLMAAVGAIAGPANTFVIFILTAILGGVSALGLLLWKGGLGRALRNCAIILREVAHLRAPYERNAELSLDHAASPRLPYAVPIAVACLVFLLL